MSEKTFRYFAYGSNMLSRRLKADKRTPSAKVIDVGYLIGHRLTFYKLSQDGSGKCDAELTNRKSDRVYGVIFQIDCNEKSALDGAEGLGYGYDSKNLNVILSSEIVIAKAYIATTKEKSLLPYHWYKALVVSGAIEHSLPNYYIEWIRSFNSKEDHNMERRAENEELLFSI